ncbi:MAG: hypothetical protein RR835_12395 [Peptostreptococcaceae bacterium]
MAKKSIKEIEVKRTGGQIALRGFSYQLIYSCYIALKFLNSDNESIRFEGIEDVDLYKSTLQNSEQINHIQLKYSLVKQNADFFDGILKNYLEVYLADGHNDNRKFTLIYDAQISKGNLSKLIDKKLDDNSRRYWIKKVEKIKKENGYWNWNGFDFDEFYNKLEFNNLRQDDIINEIDKLNIQRFNILNSNEGLFRNALFYNIFHMAQERQIITKLSLQKIIQDTIDDISKGSKNPSYKWIDKIDFNTISINNNQDYFEGKKATPSDIIGGLPITRQELENKIKNSIIKNNITVIKSSSGQGKTTLAWKVAYELSNEYSIYKINWCKDSKEIESIVEYFNSRLKIGEKILIVIDNLDEEVKEWNKLSQKLAEKIAMNYSILITTREEDWYVLSGDQSSLGSLEIIDVFIDRKQAEEIYLNLKLRNKVHNSVRNWQSAWEKVEYRKVLIEYVYLLTHGEMIEDRISNQLKRISNSISGNIKCEILRQISFSDVIGIKLRSDKFIKNLSNLYPTVDLNGIMRSIENEYFIKLNKSIDYIEGLHPVRSKYILDFLSKYQSIENTLLKLLYIVDELYVSKIYSQIPIYIGEDKEDFYSNLAESDCKKAYKYMTNAIRGIFSGSIYQYYTKQKKIFDDVNEHSGLPLFLTEINPWNSKEFGSEVKPISDMNKILPDNENISYLLKLVNNIEKHETKESDYYIYAYYLFMKLKKKELRRNKSYFSELVNWLRRIDKKFNIISNIDFDYIWECKNEWSFSDLSKLMYIYSALSKDKYIDFINKHKKEIFSYLRINTDTDKLFEEDNKIYIEYTLLPQNIRNANNESVERINAICEFLPIYEVYNTRSIKPDLDILNYVNIHDDSIKNMHLNNVVLTFNVDLNILWNKSILSQYEFQSIYDWQNYWINIRTKIVDFLKLNINVLEKKLKLQNINRNTIDNINKITHDIVSLLNRENSFPMEERPFDNSCKVTSPTKKIKNKYFTPLKNYVNQYANIINKNNCNNLCNIAMINLKNCVSELNIMQNNFNEICKDTINYFDTNELEENESKWINRLINLSEYYLENNASKYFNREDVNVYIEKKKNYLLKNTCSILEKIKHDYSFDIIKPKKIIYENDVKTLPIGIRNFNLNNENDSINLIQSLIELDEIKLEYILIVIVNSDGRALPNGIRINTNLFKEITSYIESGLATEINTKPLPYEITNEHIVYLEEEIEIVDKSSNNTTNIDLFLLYLWEYSRYKSIMNRVVPYKDEEIYLIKKMKYIKSSIIEYLNLIIKTCEFYDIDTLVKLKENIVDYDMEFNDSDLNYYINKFCVTQY